MARIIVWFVSTLSLYCRYLMKVLSSFSLVSLWHTHARWWVSVEAYTPSLNCMCVHAVCSQRSFETTKSWLGLQMFLYCTVAPKEVSEWSSRCPAKTHNINYHVIATSLSGTVKLVLVTLLLWLPLLAVLFVGFLCVNTTALAVGIISFRAKSNCTTVLAIL